MFVVRPIQDKETQIRVCSELNAEFYDNSLAFFAADLKEDGLNIDCFIGICQFYMGKKGEIIDFTIAEGRENDEAVIVMLRAVMSFMNRCGVSSAFFAENAATEYWLKKSGFVNKNGTYEIDLDLFYTSPCKYSDNE